MGFKGLPIVTCSLMGCRRRSVNVNDSERRSERKRMCRLSCRPHRKTDRHYNCDNNDKETSTIYEEVVEVGSLSETELFEMDITKEARLIVHWHLAVNFEMFCSSEKSTIILSPLGRGCAIGSVRRLCRVRKRETARLKHKRRRSWAFCTNRRG
jgi:hypothetical protein